MLIQGKTERSEPNEFQTGGGFERTVTNLIDFKRGSVRIVAPFSLKLNTKGEVICFKIKCFLSTHFFLSGNFYALFLSEKGLIVPLFGLELANRAFIKTFRKIHAILQ